MVLIAVLIAVILYIVIFFSYEYLTSSNGVGFDLLYSMKRMVFSLPDSIALACLKWGIGLVIFYLVAEAIFHAVRPKSSTRQVRAFRRARDKRRRDAS